MDYYPCDFNPHDASHVELAIPPTGRTGGPSECLHAYMPMDHDRDKIDLGHGVHVAAGQCRTGRPCLEIAHLGRPAKAFRVGPASSSSTCASPGGWPVGPAGQSVSSAILQPAAVRAMRAAGRLAIGPLTLLKRRDWSCEHV